MHYVHDNAGICSECLYKMEFTKRNDTFHGSKHMELVVSLLFYTGITKEIIKDFKFSSCIKNGDVLNNIMADFMKDFEIFSDIDVVVPVPLSKERLMKRGFNQAQPLAECMGRILNKPVDNSLVIRVKNTKQQSILSAKERAENVKNAFVAKGENTGKRILLADDICTTRSTLDSCAKVLVEAGAEKVMGITYAIHKNKEEKDFIPPLVPVKN